MQMVKREREVTEPGTHQKKRLKPKGQRNTRRDTHWPQKTHECSKGDLNVLETKREANQRGLLGGGSKKKRKEGRPSGAEHPLKELGTPRPKEGGWLAERDCKHMQYTEVNSVDRGRENKRGANQPSTNLVEKQRLRSVAQAWLREHMTNAPANAWG